jgi:hypothetical protein
MKLNSIVVALACLALTSACTNPLVKSTHIEKESAGLGIAYALPIGQLLITAERAQITPEDVKKAEAAVGDMTQKVEVSKKALEAAKLAQSEAEGVLKQDATITSQAEKVRIAVATTNYLTAIVAGDEKLLAEAKKKFDELKINVGKWKESVALKQLPITPDPKARFVAEFDHEPARDDDFKLSTVNGLLSTSNATTTDRTLDIVEAIATAAAQFSMPFDFLLPQKGVNAYMTAQAVPPPPGGGKQCGAYKVSRVFEALSQRQLYLLNCDLKDVGSAYRVNLSGEEADNCSEASTPATARIEKLKNISELKGELSTGDGVMYRALTSATVNAQPTANSVSKLQGETACSFESVPEHVALSVMVPDSRITYRVDPKGAAFTRASAAYTFKEGTLIDASEVNPSEIAAVVGLPVRVVRAMLTAVTDIVRLRVDYDSKQNELIKAQADRVNALIQLNEGNKTLKQSFGSEQPLPPAGQVP